LRKIAAQQDAEFADAPAIGQIVLQEQVAVINELFYTEGTEALKQARADIAQFSLRRAADRIQRVKKRRADPELATVRNC
jgi:U4/U6 small nuclear ribonucleoprotein PRP4